MSVNWNGDNGSWFSSDIRDDGREASEYWMPSYGSKCPHMAMVLQLAIGTGVTIYRIAAIYLIFNEFLFGVVT